MTHTTADIIRERFPGRVVLMPKQVAEVIGQHPDHVRDRLLRDTLIPGLRKDGGRWRVPVADLVEAVDRLTRPVPPPAVTRSQMASTASPTRRRRPLGPHLAAIHASAQR